MHTENEDIRDTAFYIMGQIPSEKMHDIALSIISDGIELEKGIFAHFRCLALQIKTISLSVD
jgi:hypothetical protein